MDAGFLTDVFRIRLKVKTKQGKVAEAVKIFKKLLDPEKRFRPIPEIFYFSIRDGHVLVEIHEQEDAVVVEVLPGPQFKNISDIVWQTAKTFGFEGVAKEGFNFKADMSSPQGFIDKAMSFALCEDDFFFPHFLDETTVNIEYDRKHSHVAVLDKFLNLLITERRLINFSAFDFIDADIEVDLDTLEVDPIDQVHQRSCQTKLLIRFSRICLQKHPRASVFLLREATEANF